MKLTCLVITLLAVVQFNAFAESSRKTTSDIYLESYDGQMKGYLASQPSQYRAETYRARYEKCDADHACINETSRGILNPQQNTETQKHEQTPIIVWPLL